MKIHATCSACRHWLAKSGNSGECRRLPPLPLVYVESKTTGDYPDYRETVESYTRSEFPETTAADWCGEFQLTSTDH